MNRNVYILRGLPGSGKSTKAKEIAAQHGLIKQSTIICSTDDFFIIDGKYQFDPKKLGTNHSKNFVRFSDAIKRNVKCIIVDNTNIQHHDYKKYVTHALNNGYEVQIIEVGLLDEESIKIYANRNTHGVPIESIRRMATKYQELI